MSMALRAYGYDGVEQLQMTIPGNETSFPFVDGGIFRMTTKKCPDLYVVMNRQYHDDSDACDVHGKQGYPGDQGEFKFTSVGRHIYNISSKRWPGWYLCHVEEKNVLAVCDGAYRTCNWQIIPRRDGTVLLATDIYSGHGTKWYMYMEDGGDIQVTTNPDERAHFILSCDIQLKCGEDRCMVAAPRAAPMELSAHIEYIRLDEQAPDNSSSVDAAEINAMTHTLDQEADNSLHADAGDLKSTVPTLDRAPDTSLNIDTAENT